MSGADTRFVGAPLYASAYPQRMLGRPGYVCKTHVFELRGSDPSDPIRVLCGNVSLDSYFEDDTQHVPPADVSCETCARRFRKLSSHEGEAKR